MDNRDKRVLWLINHTTLRSSEVPLLQELGYEVYTPKIFPSDEANQSASVDYSYDRQLTIPAALLDALNAHDFYSTPWPPNLAAAINKYFATTFCAFFPNMINVTIASFSGKILLRVFGLAGRTTYASLIEHYCRKETVEAIKTVPSKVYFAQSYDNLADIEPGWIRRIAATLPLGLPKPIYQYANTWLGNKVTVLFVCPRIKTSPYYNHIYTSFKANFGDLPHIIAGAQPEPVYEDNNVLGFVPQNSYRELMQAAKVMFYHSTEERHLHYHPLEAIMHGMPVVFMKGSLFDTLFPVKSPARCCSYQEAREKIHRVLNDDHDFIHQIIHAQIAVGELFTPDYITKQWRISFVNKVMNKINLNETD